MTGSTQVVNNLSKSNYVFFYITYIYFLYLFRAMVSVLYLLYRLIWDCWSSVFFSLSQLEGEVFIHPSTGLFLYWMDLYQILSTDGSHTMYPQDFGDHLAFPWAPPPWVWIHSFQWIVSTFVGQIAKKCGTGLVRDDYYDGEHGKH